ncbi:MAG TPA: tetratricopeptide repeat protein, partial [Blastocatellia bacterium]|nr:tetratricopeptide repeat protein [Blastocatellia bacterium]
MKQCRVVVRSMIVAMFAVVLSAAIALQALGQNVESDWEKAVSLYKQEQYQLAINEFQKVVTEFPNHADSWKFVGLSYFQLKQYDQAIAPLEKALALKRSENKPDSDVLLALSRSHLALKQYDKALPLLEALGKTQTNNAAIAYLLGFTYANLKRPDEAATALNAAVKLDPKDVDSWYYLAVLKVRSNKLDEAITALRGGITAAPSHIEMHTLLVESLLRRGVTESNEQKAAAYYDEAIRTAVKLKSLRDDATSTELLGRAYLTAKKYTNAEMTLSRALAMTKQPTATLYFNLGFAHAQNKAWARAAEMLVQADRLKPNDIDTLTYLGYV